MELIRRLDALAARQPGVVAHRSGEASLTHGELHDRSRRLAAWLRGHAPRGTPVALRGHKEPAMLVGFVGALRAGIPYIPLDTDIPPMRVDRIRALAGAQTVLTPSDIDEITRSGRPAPAEALDDHPDSPVYLMFTSGSTGDPKGVVITQRCLETFAFGMLDMLDARSPVAGEVVINQTPFSFDMSLMDVWLALLGGGTLVSLTRAQVEAPRDLYRAIAESEATTWISTPSFVQMCMAERRFAPGMLPRLKRFGLGGEALPPPLIRRVFERFGAVEMWNIYGPTETTVACTLGWVEPWMLDRFPSVPIGGALPGTWVGVLDPQGRPVADGERGEIVVAGPNVSPGYLGRPDLTEQGFFRHGDQPAYRTGDLGHVEDGHLLYDGRMHGLVKVRGNRIELGDVEANLRALDGVVQSVVLVREGPSPALVGFVLLDAPPSRPPMELSQEYRARLQERVPRYMVPQKLIFVDGFPMTTNGKIDRRRLAELMA